MATRETLPLIRNPFGRRLPRTPFYLYDERIQTQLTRRFQQTLMEAPIDIYFAMKANSHTQVLKCFRRLGVGMDLASAGEMRIARRAGFSPRQMIFSGVGKTDEELEQAVRAGVRLINIESRSEFERLCRIARRLRRKPDIAFRVNPDVSVKTHRYIATGGAEHKFGVSAREAAKLYREAQASATVAVTGMSLHIGSQMMDFSALQVAVKRAIAFATDLKAHGIPLQILDIGGGVGVHYDSPERFPPFERFARVAILAAREWRRLQGSGARIMIEPGRALVAQSGVLVTTVVALKKAKRKTFAICDAGMNDLIRPALYEAKHPVWKFVGSERGPQRTYDLVGPICETADTFREDLRLPELREGDVLAIGCAGAYGRVMASQYNGRPLCPEIWIPTR